MYTLRIIEETRENEKFPFEQVIENFELGNSYSRIKKGCSKEFDSIIKKNFPLESTEEVESIICGENEKVFFIYEITELRNNAYFIMTDSGKTLERL